MNQFQGWAIWILGLTLLVGVFVRYREVQSSLPAIAKVIKVTGNAKIRREGLLTWDQATDQEMLNAGSVVRTGSKSEIQIESKKLGKLTINENSLIVLSQATGFFRNSDLVSILKGKVIQEKPIFKFEAPNWIPKTLGINRFVTSIVESVKVLDDKFEVTPPEKTLENLEKKSEESKEIISDFEAEMDEDSVAEDSKLNLEFEAAVRNNKSLATLIAKTPEPVVTVQPKPIVKVRPVAPIIKTPAAADPAKKAIQDQFKWCLPKCLLLPKNAQSKDDFYKDLSDQTKIPVKALEDTLESALVENLPESAHIVMRKTATKNLHSKFGLVVRNDCSQQVNSSSRVKSWLAFDTNLFKLAFDVLDSSLWELSLCKQAIPRTSLASQVNTLILQNENGLSFVYGKGLRSTEIEQIKSGLQSLLNLKLVAVAKRRQLFSSLDFLKSVAQTGSFLLIPEQGEPFSVPNKIAISHPKFDTLVPQNSFFVFPFEPSNRGGGL
jgi:hypothetical protein